MAEDQVTLAKRYAHALFELTHEAQVDETTLNQLLAIQQVFNEQAELMPILTSTELSEADKQQLLKTLTQQANEYVQNLFALLGDYNRLPLMDAIIATYQQIVDRSVNRVRAQVTTAIQMDEEQAERLRAKLAQRFNAQAVELSVTVDSAILGGVIVEANHQVIDGSIATQLKRMRRSILD